MGSGSVVVGITYPSAWEQRPQEELDADLDRLRAIDPRIEVVDVRYVEPDAVRTRRGAAAAAGSTARPDGTAGSRVAGGTAAVLASPVLTGEQRAGFAKVEIVLAQDLPPEVATVAPRLRWVQGMGAGVSQLEASGLAGAGIRLTTAAGVNAVAIAEFVMARLLQVWKRLPEIDAQQAAGRWAPLHGREVDGSVLVVVGLGAIGREVARRGRAFGMHVVGIRRTPGPRPEVDELHPPEQLLDVLSRAEAVVAALPESPATVGMFDAAAFAAMGPGTIFCNVGRGSAVDEDALVAALAAGRPGVAVLDVVRDEPLLPSSVLWRTPGVMISPHSASSPDRYWERLHRLFRDNVERYLDGRPLLNDVRPPPHPPRRPS